MGYKLLAMGALIKLIFLILVLKICIIFSQSCIVKIKEKDSIKFEKLEKNEYRLSIFNKNNIEYNKSKGLNYNNYIHGVRFCDECKEEVIYLTLLPIKYVLNKKDKIYSIQNLLNKNLKKDCYFFSNGLFIIEKKTYRILKKID